MRIKIHINAYLEKLIKKIVCYTIDQNLVFKKNDIFPHETVWMNQMALLIEASLSQTDKDGSETFKGPNTHQRGSEQPLPVCRAHRRESIVNGFSYGKVIINS